MSQNICLSESVTPPMTNRNCPEKLARREKVTNALRRAREAQDPDRLGVLFEAAAALREHLEEHGCERCLAQNGAADSR